MRIVLIEWDGKQPSTTFYNGMRRLNLKVRGNKDQDPIVRRSRLEDHSVIVQEGAVLVESESLARQVAYLAKENGARSVFVGECEIDLDERGRQMTQAEVDVVNRFNQAFRQRGRPQHKEEHSWVTTCPECVHSSTKVSERPIIQCPNCGGLRVSARVGTRHVFSGTPKDLEEWKNMFFVEGNFEVPILQTLGSSEVVREVVLDGENLDVYNGLKASPMVNSYLVNRLDINMFRDLLGDLFVARRYYSKKDRQHARS